MYNVKQIRLGRGDVDIQDIFYDVANRERKARRIKIISKEREESKRWGKDKGRRRRRRGSSSLLHTKINIHRADEDLYHARQQ